MIEPQWLPPWSRAEGAARAAGLFAATFGDIPEGVWSAPGRVNLMGEHTDHTNGIALPIALPHRTYAAIRRRLDGQVRMVSAQEPGQRWEVGLAEVSPGAVAGWGAQVAGVAWALAEDGFLVGGFDVAIDSCVPMGAALSSSAALQCAIAVGIADLFGLGLAETAQGRWDLVVACRDAENCIVGTPAAGLDQAAALLCSPGHALRLDFAPGLPVGEFARLVPFDLVAAGLTLLVCASRATSVHAEQPYAARRHTLEQAAAVLDVASLRDVDPAWFPQAVEGLEVIDADGVLRRRTRHVVTEIDRTRSLVQLLSDGFDAPTEFNQAKAHQAGALLNASHDSLRDDFEVSARQTDLAVNTARAVGAIGARMTGAGLGASMIALVHSDQAQSVAAAIAGVFAESGLAQPTFLDGRPSGAAGRDQ